MIQPEELEQTKSNNEKILTPFKPLVPYRNLIDTLNLLLGISADVPKGCNAIAIEMSHALVVARRNIAAQLIVEIAANTELTQKERIEQISVVKNGGKL